MFNCSAPNTIAWLAALGPTIATLFAGIATILVYVRGERFQRQLVRPVLVVRDKIRSESEGVVRWIAQINNEGQGAAHVEMFAVIAGERAIRPEPMQSAAEYWSTVLSALGILDVEQVEGEFVSPPLSIGSGGERVLFDAHVRGQRQQISAAIKSIEIRIDGRSALGERFAIHHRFIGG